LAYIAHPQGNEPCPCTVLETDRMPLWRYQFQLDVRISNVFLVSFTIDSKTVSLK